MKGIVHLTLTAFALLCACQKPPEPAGPVSDLAPDGVYFLKVAAQGVIGEKTVEKRPGTLLNRFEENTYYATDGTVLQLTPQYVTNDMRVVRMIQIEERGRPVEPTPVPAPPPTPMPTPAATRAPTPAWENPLGKPPYRSGGVRSRYEIPTTPYYR